VKNCIENNKNFQAEKAEYRLFGQLFFHRPKDITEYMGGQQ